MIRLLEGKEKNLLKHHPWVFSGALDESSLVSDAAGGAEAGLGAGAADGASADLVPDAAGGAEAGLGAGVQRVETSDGRFVAWGYYDKDSHIPLRLLSWKEKEYPDTAWWTKTVRESVLRRKCFFQDMSADTNVFRIIHGEADLLPGVVADVYGKIIRIIISARVAWNLRQVFVDALEGLLHPQMIILNTDAAFCAIEKLHEVTEYYKGGQRFVPTEKFEEIRIREDGLYYGLIPGSGQKSGFYCDQRENRKRVQQYVKDAVVFDGCSYTGGFTLHALKGGCKHVDAFDSSADAVHRLLSNVKLNVDLGILPSDCLDKVSATKADIFETLRTIAPNQYDVMILDPPKLAQTIKALDNAKKAYKDLNRLAMEKIKNGGILVTCSCSGSLKREDFRTVLAWSAKDAGVEVQILETLGQAMDHPVRMSFPESEYLKVYILRVIK